MIGAPTIVVTDAVGTETQVPTAGRVVTFAHPDGTAMHVAVDADGGIKLTVPATQAVHVIEWNATAASYGVRHL